MTYKQGIHTFFVLLPLLFPFIYTFIDIVVAGIKSHLFHYRSCCVDSCPSVYRHTERCIRKTAKRHKYSYNQSVLNNCYCVLSVKMPNKTVTFLRFWSKICLSGQLSCLDSWCVRLKRNWPSEKKVVTCFFFSFFFILLYSFTMFVLNLIEWIIGNRKILISFHFVLK